MATRRVAKEDIQLGGFTIKAGEGIIAATQSASRDEDVFSDPEKFDILRFAPKESGGRGEDWVEGMGKSPQCKVDLWLQNVLDIFCLCKELFLPLLLRNKLTLYLQDLDGASTDVWPKGWRDDSWKLYFVSVLFAFLYG